jgi:hypothetical protein
MVIKATVMIRDFLMCPNFVTPTYTPKMVRNSAVDRQKNDTLSLHIGSFMVALHGPVLASGHRPSSKKPIPSRKIGLFGKKLGVLLFAQILTR